MDYAIPASKISALSSGEFVGIVADNPEQKIKLKMFHCEIQNDHKAIAAEEASYNPIPIIERVSANDVAENYKKIKSEVERLLLEECKKIESKYPKVEKSRSEKNADEQNESQTVSM